MVEWHATPITSAEQAGEPPPPGLRQDSPVPWQPVWGPDDSWRRQLEDLAVRAALRGVVALPEPMLDVTLSALARIGARVDRRHSRAARGFLRQVLGDLPQPELERRVVGAYRHLLRVVVASQRMPRRVPLARMRAHFDIQWTPEIEHVRDAASGCILVTGHIGNWEAASAIAPWVGFDPVCVVAKPMRNRPLSKTVQRERERRGVRVLPRRGAMQAVPAFVRAGGTVCMLLDQRASTKPVLAPFFGRPARCDRSAGVLIRRARVPVVVTACYFTERPLHYRVEFFDLISPDDVARAGPVAIATRINRALEKAILKHPEQYFWLHDRYRDAPLDAPSDAPGPQVEPVAAPKEGQA